MPLKLSVGLSRKIGQPDFGSVGASCGIEAELEPALLDRDQQAFRHRVRELYTICALSVHEELARQQGSLTPARVNGHGPRERNRAADGKTQNGKASRADRPATPSQVRALHALANRQQLDLAELIQERFGVSLPEQLTVASASSLIEELQSTSAGAANG